MADSASTTFSDALSDIGGYFTDTSESQGPIGTYFWQKEFNQFLTSYNNVLNAEGNWCLDPGYSFKVVNWRTKSPCSAFGEFRLPINPQAISKDIEFAINIKPTVGGVVVNHAGNVFEDISISGTMGLINKSARNKLDSMISQSGGISESLENIGEIISPEGIFGTVLGSISGFDTAHTGYTWSHLFLNYIKAYVQAKTLPSNHEIILVFCNKKDNEEWQVEPTGFSLNQSFQHNNMYDYRLSMKAIRRNVRYVKPGGFLDSIDSIAATIGRVENIVQSSLNLLTIGSNFLSTSIHRFYELENSVQNAVLAPVATLISNLVAIRDTAVKFPATQRQVLENIKTNLRKIRDNWAILNDCSTDQYNQWYHRQNVAKAVTPIDQGQVRDFAIESNNAFLQIEQGLNRILATNVLFNSAANDPAITELAPASSTTSSINKLSTAYNRISSRNTISKYFSGGLTAQQWSSSRDARVLGSDSMESIALRELGNINLWADLAYFNKLVFPYISDDPIYADNDRVLKTGSVIKIPSNSTAAVGSAQTKESPRLSYMSQTEKMMGVDIKLTPEWDYSITASGDIAMVGGFKNVPQALDIKLSVQQKEMLRHPNFGIGLTPGDRSMTALDVLGSLEDSILVDPRFELIQSARVKREGSKYYIALQLKLAGSKLPVPYNIRI